MSESPRLAKRITITRKGDSYECTVDGEPFPYLVATEPVQVDLTDHCPGVLLKILAEEVTVEHGLPSGTIRRVVAE